MQIIEFDSGFITFEHFERRLVNGVSGAVFFRSQTFRYSYDGVETYVQV